MVVCSSDRTQQRMTPSSTAHARPRSRSSKEDQAASQATPASRSPASRRRAASAVATMAQAPATLGSHINSRASLGTSSSLTRSSRSSSEAAALRDAHPGVRGLAEAVTDRLTKCNRSSVSASILPRLWAAPGLAHEIVAPPVRRAGHQARIPQHVGGHSRKPTLSPSTSQEDTPRRRGT